MGVGLLTFYGEEVSLALLLLSHLFFFLSIADTQKHVHIPWAPCVELSACVELTPRVT